MKNVLLIFILGLLLSCGKKEDCSLCVSLPESFVFDFVDVESGEDLFEIKDYSASDLEIVNTLNNNESVDFEFITEGESNYIVINSIALRPGVLNFKFYLTSQDLFDLYLDSEIIEENCCSLMQYNEITIKNISYQENQSKYYTIFVD